jgi:hypothetical protein
MASRSFKIDVQTVLHILRGRRTRLRTRGVLTIGADQALFQPGSGDSILIKNVMTVTKGWKDSVTGVWLPWVVNAYIEIIFGDPASPSVVFVNDPDGSGWRRIFLIARLCDPFRR